jgi:hypothetical protein
MGFLQQSRFCGRLCRRCVPSLSDCLDATPIGNGDRNYLGQICLAAVEMSGHAIPR